MSAGLDPCGGHENAPGASPTAEEWNKLLCSEQRLHQASRSYSHPMLQPGRDPKADQVLGNWELGLV